MTSLIGVGFAYRNSLIKNNYLWLRRYSMLNRSKAHIIISNCQVGDSRVRESYRCITQKLTSRREEKFRIKDGVPSDYELVYKAPMDSYVTGAQGVATLSLAMIASAGVYEVFFGIGELSTNTMIENYEQFVLAVSALIMANVSMLSVAFRYPLRIYNRNNEYKSVFTGILPTQTRIIEFKCRDVKRVDSNSVLPWRDSIFKINKKKVFILDHFFRKPSDFSKMLDGEQTSSAGEK